MSHVYCPECGFQNPEAANYCTKCGALLVRDESGADTTMSFTPEEGDEESADILDEIKTEGPALVVRSGGGRAGEHFLLEEESTTVGRSPDCDILDDVTVSRRHALVKRSNDRFLIEDQGSLNGTFLNRRRIESGGLEDGDEVQIGKYKLTFLTALARCRKPSLPRACCTSGPSAVLCRTSFRTSRSRRSATSRTRGCSSRSGRRAATGSSTRTTSSACARSCGCSGTNSFPSG